VRQPPYNPRVAGGLCCHEQQEQPGLRRHGLEPPPETLIDLARERQRLGTAEPARKLCGRQLPLHLQQGRRVPPRLGHDSLAHPRVTRPRDGGSQQLQRIRIPQTLDDELRESREIVGRLTRGEHDRDRLHGQTARDERERLRRCAIQPLRIVDNAEQRALLGQIRQEAENGQPDDKTVRRNSRVQTEHGPQRVALRARKALQPIHPWRAQLVQSCELVLRLCLDACRARNPQI
jgi:hypothetical protein